MAEHGKYCPIMVAGENKYVSECIGKDCTWWLPYANDCALPVIAGKKLKNAESSATMGSEL